jgi:hypothetical protein
MNKIKELKIVEQFEDLPDEVISAVRNNLAKDILNRYDNPAYHDEDIIHNTLQEYGYKLKD